MTVLQPKEVAADVHREDENEGKFDDNICETQLNGGKLIENNCERQWRRSGGWGIYPLQYLTRGDGLCNHPPKL